MLKKICWLLIVGCVALFAAPPDILLKGSVKDTKGVAIAGASVTLEKESTVKTTSNDKGEFVLEYPPSGVVAGVGNNSAVHHLGMQGANFVFYTREAGVQGIIALFNGNGRKIFTQSTKSIDAGRQQVALPLQVPGVYVLRYTIGQESSTLKLLSAGNEVFVDGTTMNAKSFVTTSAAAAGVDVIIVNKPNYSTARVAVDSYKKSDIAVVLEAAGPVVCKLPDLPASSGLTKENPKLPDPFTFYDGTKLTRKDQWECRRQEILAMASKYIYGPCPRKPDEVTGTVSGGTIKIDCKVGTKTASFSPTISGSGDAIVLDVGSGITPSGAKSLSFDKNDKDWVSKIKTLYGISEITENMASAWMVDRVMDVLELNPTSGHDPKKIMVSGCSGCGKAAFLIGAFSRIPLTVIVESGGGGASSLRQTEWFRHGDGKKNYDCLDQGAQKPPQGIDNLENTGACAPWVASVASWIRSSPAKVKVLPFDQHLLLACIAPRYLCHVTNQHGKGEWCHLGGTPEALSAWAAEPVWNALGVPENMGFMMYSESTAPGHCSRPGSATGLAGEFFKRVFKGDATAKTDVMTIGQGDKDLQQPQGEWKAMWIDWNMETKLE